MNLILLGGALGIALQTYATYRIGKETFKKGENNV